MVFTILLRTTTTTPDIRYFFFHHISAIFSHPHASEILVSSLPFFISLHSVSEASSPSGYCGLYSCLSTSLPFIQKASGLARFFICVNFTPIAAVIRPGCCCIDVMASYFPGSSSASYKTPSPGLISSSSSFSSLLSLKQKAFKPSAFEPEALKDKYPTNTGSKESYKHKLSFFVVSFFVVSFFVFSSSKTIPYQHELKYCIRPTSRAQRQPCKHRPTSTGLQAGGLERHSYKHNPSILPTQPDQHYPTNTILQTQTVDHVVPHG